MAEVTLAEIPFVSLRHGLPAKLLAGHASFNETVLAAQAALAAPALLLDLGRRCIQAGGQTIELPPAELALLAVFARQAKQGGEALPAPPKGVPDMDWAKRYLKEYRACHHNMADIEATERALKDGMEGEYFSQRKSKLERRLKAALGPAAIHYRIDDGACRPRSYSMLLEPGSVSFVQPAKNHTAYDALERE